MLKWHQKTDALFMTGLGAVMVACYVSGHWQTVATPTNILLAWAVQQLCAIYDELRERRL